MPCPSSGQDAESPNPDTNSCSAQLRGSALWRRKQRRGQAAQQAPPAKAKSSLEIGGVGDDDIWCAWERGTVFAASTSGHMRISGPTLPQHLRPGVPRFNTSGPSLKRVRETSTAARLPVLFKQILSLLICSRDGSGLLRQLETLSCRLLATT